MTGSGNFVAIKIHFGEHGNLAFIGSNCVRVIVGDLAKLGAKAFVIDANTLYKVSRSNAIDHLRSGSASMNA